MTGKKNKSSKPQETFTKDNPLCAGGLRLYVGAKIEALDSRRWYLAKIVKINDSTHRLLVHYEGWNSRHDKWFDCDSSSLRSLSSSEENQDESSKGKEIKPGDKVLARWSDSKFYPAKVHAVVSEKLFEVIFFDGFKKKLNKSSIRPDTKKTFENFEEKFTFPPAESESITTSSTAARTATIKPPVVPPPNNRTKRRHTEPSTMADFVTTIPGKRSKHHVGTPSDSDDILSPNEVWEQKSKEEDVNCQGETFPDGRRGLALRKQRRFGFPVEEDSLPLQSKSDRQSSDVSVKKFRQKDLLSPSSHSVHYRKVSAKKGANEEDNSMSMSKLSRRKPIGNILQVKLPLKLQSRRRGRKKRFFRLGNDDPSADTTLGDGSAEEKTLVDSVECDAPLKAEQSCTTAETEANIPQQHHVSPERVQKRLQHKVSRFKRRKRKGRTHLLSHKGLQVHGDEQSSPRSNTLDGLSDSKDASKTADVSPALPVSEGLLRVPKKRGRKPGKLNSAKVSIGEPKILPRRERKLTEKGLELLQIIGHKKGLECHLKEAFVCVDAVENFSIKDHTSGTSNILSLDKQGIDKCDGVGKEKYDEAVVGKMKGDVEDVFKLSGENNGILQEDESKRPGGVFKEKSVVNSKGGECVVESHTMPEVYEMSKDDDRYSDISEGSDSLVIDIGDDLTRGDNSEKKHGETRLGAVAKNRQGKSADTLQGMDVKPRLFPRLKYTLSHEERRGNKLAKLKRNRLKKKYRGAKGRKARESVKELEKVETDSLTGQSLDGSESSLNNQSSAGVSPLESLTKMVTETPDIVALSSDGKGTSLPDTRLSGTYEETSKPVKGTKQQRAPYKPRLKMTDSFLSMVEQDRPSQIDRPLADDLIKEKSIRGRPRHRFTNRTDNQSYQESTVKKREDVQQSDLNEPLEFSTSSPSRETIDLNKADRPNIVYPRQNLTSFVAEQNIYGQAHMGAFTAAPGAVVGAMHLPHPSQQMDLYRAGSPQSAMAPLPIVNPETLGYDKRVSNASYISPFEGMMGMSEGKGPLLDYSAHLQSLISSNGNTMLPATHLPVDSAQRCLRMQGPGATPQGPWDSQQKKREDCPCQECCKNATARPEGIINKEKNETKQDAARSSRYVVSPCQGEVNSVGKTEGVAMPSTMDMERNKDMSQELVITDVFSLRDPNNKISSVGAPGRAVSPLDSNEQSNTGNRLHGSPGKKEVSENAKEAPKETNDAGHVPGKPKEFETKKKRLDLITGKLSAQKRLSPYDDTLSSSEKNERESCSPAVSIKTEEPAKPVSPFSKQNAITPEQAFKSQQQRGYMYPQTSFLPVFNPYLDPRPGVPPSSLEVPPARGVSLESRLVPHHSVYMDPRSHYPSPEYFQPIRPMYDTEGIPPPNYQHPSPAGIPYIPPDMVGHMRFHQMPGFPYYSPRFTPTPRYFIPREPLPMPTARQPPPYSTFPMVSSPQRFRAIAPSGRMPLVVCKQTNCNCHLPHSAPPIQVLPPNSQTTQVPEKAPEEDVPSSKAVQTTVKGNEPMMKGDPRRLTLPLQRMKKMGLRLGKGSNDSSHSKTGRDQSSSDDVEKEDKEENGIAEKQDDFEADNDDDANKTLSNSRSENGKSGKGDSSKRHGAMRKHEKGQKKESVLAPREFVVELNLNEFQCKFKGCKKSFRKASSRDNHQRYFHSPRVPQRKRKPSSSLPSPASSDVPASPAFPKIDFKISNEDLTSNRSGYSSSAITDDNMSDHDKHEESSSDESDDSFLDSNGSVCVDDIIRCKCGDLEEQGFMIQCEQCFTWQHGDCVNLTVQSVPKNYLCYVCLNPKGLRPSFKYKNNYDWYKRGTLPSLVELEDENQERIAELMQASHALMEDIANVFDVIAGMKKKIALLNEPSHPALRFWWPTEESKKKAVCDSKVGDQLENKKDVSMASNAEEGDMDKIEIKKDSDNIDGQKMDVTEEASGNLTNDKDSVSGESKDDVSREEKHPLEEQASKVGTQSDVGGQLEQSQSNVDQQSEQSKSGVDQGSEQSQSNVDQQSEQLQPSSDQQLEQSKSSVDQQSEQSKSSVDQQSEQSQSSVDRRSQYDVSMNGVKNTETPTVTETAKDSEKVAEKTEVPESKLVDSKSEADNGETTQNESLDVLNAKLNLQDHLDDIENKLNQRMDEIESNMDVLEQKYMECEKKANEGEPKSAFKITLPDMTSVVRHLNMINRQLVNIT